MSSGKTVAFVDTEGKYYELLPQPYTPLNAIPAGFWLFSAVFLFIPLIGAFVWSYRQGLRESNLLFVTSLTYYIFFFVGTTNLHKELAFGSDLAETLATIEVVCMSIYIPALTILTASYPHQLLKDYWYYIFTGVMALLTLNFCFQWIDLPIHNFFLSSIPTTVLTLTLGKIQVKRSRYSPLERTVARTIQLSIMGPFLPVVLLYVIPIMLGIEPLMSRDVVQIMGIGVFIGLAIGILRFRLFEVEYWWFKSWLWLLGGCVVVLVDMLLISLLNTPQLYALGLSVMLTGFLYFPLRQWLLGKLMPLENQSLQDFLPRFSAALAQADSPQAFEKSWQAILQARFTPQHLALQTATLTQPTLADNGLSLRVPALSDGTVYQLSGKHLAARLFNHADIKVAAALLDIARMARNASDAREQAVLEERERLLHDLQATVGAKLRALADDLPAAHDRQATEEALQALDSTVKLSLQADPFSLHGHLHAWHTEIAQRTAAA